MLISCSAFSIQYILIPSSVFRAAQYIANLPLFIYMGHFDQHRVHYGCISMGLCPSTYLVITRPTRNINGVAYVTDRVDPPL